MNAGYSKARAHLMACAHSGQRTCAYL